MTVHEMGGKHYIIDSYDTWILLLPYMNKVIYTFQYNNQSMAIVI